MSWGTYDVRKFSKMRDYRKRRFRRRKKSVWRRRWFWDIVLGFVFIVSLSYLLFFASFFRVRMAPKFVPTKNISNLEFISEVLDEVTGKSIFLIRTNALEARILEIVPEFEKVEISRSIRWRDLSFHYTLRKPAAIVCDNVSSSDCCLVDNSSISFGCGNTFEWWDREHLAIVFSNRNLIFKDEVSKIVKIQQWAKKNDIFDIEKFMLVSQQQLNVLTIEGWEMYFDLSDDINLALTKLKLLLEQEITQDKRKNLEYIDLRFSKVYYR